MDDYKGIKAIVFLSVIALFLLVPSALARSHNKSTFEYVAGTQSLPKGCQGKLEMAQENMIFDCPGGSITVPYTSITRMEYQEKINKQIRKMTLDWAINPPSSHNKHEGYFTVLYSEKGQTHAMILKVSPETMRPYLAEIDLKTGLSIHNNQN